MPALVVADGAQALRQQRQNLVPESQVGAERIGKDHGPPVRIAVDSIVQPHVAQIRNPHPCVLPAFRGI